MNNLNEYRDAILGWARDRNLIEGSTPSKQLDKLFEEIGEFAGAAARSTVPEKREEMLVKMRDGLGDTFVVICIISEQMGVELDFFEMESFTDLPANSMMYLTAGFLAGFVEQTKHGMIAPESDNTEQFYFFVAASIAVAEHNGFDFLDCVDMAWNEIKDRKGRMIDGVFVKEADL